MKSRHSVFRVRLSVADLNEVGLRIALAISPQMKTEATGLGYSSPVPLRLASAHKKGKPTDAPIGAFRTVSFPDLCLNPRTTFLPAERARFTRAPRALPAASLV